MFAAGPAVLASCTSRNKVYALAASWCTEVKVIENMVEALAVVPLSDVGQLEEGLLSLAPCRTQIITG